PATAGKVAVPVRTLDHVIAVAQGSDAVRAHLIIGIAADQAIGVGDGAADPSAAVAPRDRPADVVPALTFDHVVAVAQRGDAVESHLIISVAADEAIGVRDGAAHPGAATAPGHRPAPAVPIDTSDYIVAVAQREDTVKADEVTRI